MTASACFALGHRVARTAESDWFADRREIHLVEIISDGSFGQEMGKTYPGMLGDVTEGIIGELGDCITVILFIVLRKGTESVGDDLHQDSACTLGTPSGIVDLDISFAGVSGQRVSLHESLGVELLPTPVLAGAVVIVARTGVIQQTEDLVGKSLAAKGTPVDWLARVTASPDLDCCPILVVLGVVIAPSVEVVSRLYF